MTENPHIAPDYLDRLQQVYGELTDEQRRLLYEQPSTCECDRFKHEKLQCPNPPQDNGTVMSSPALCTACLFYCWADDDD